MAGNRVVSMTRYQSQPHPTHASTTARPEREWQETWSDYASHTGTASRQRLKLVAKGLAHRLQESARDARQSGRRTVKRIGIRAALMASHKLMQIAGRIERRVQKLQNTD
jgi:hypothetical protein